MIWFVFADSLEILQQLIDKIAHCTQLYNLEIININKLKVKVIIKKMLLTVS